MKSVLLLAIFICITDCRTIDTLSPSQTLWTVKDVIAFGLDVFAFSDYLVSGGNGSTPAAADSNKMIATISDRIGTATDAVIFKDELQSYTLDLRNAELTIKALLADMRDIFATKDMFTRDEYKRQFHENFYKQKAELFTIKSLLTSNINESSTLLTLVTSIFECGMTNLEKFQTYYMTLVSNVVALEFLDEKISDRARLYNETFQSWKTTISSLLIDFDDQMDECKSKFFELARKDFDDIDDPLKLFDNNQHRYPYKASDVLFLGGSYCVRVLKNYNEIFKKMKDNEMTFVVINKGSTLSRSTERHQVIASNSTFEKCIYDTDQIISSFDAVGEYLLFWLTFPQDQTAEFHILFDTDTTARTVITESDGRNYTTIIYVRVLDGNIAGLTVDDYDVGFYQKPATEESSGLKDWQLGLIITFSILAVVLIVVAGYYIVFRYRQLRGPKRNMKMSWPLVRSLFYRFNRR